MTRARWLSRVAVGVLGALVLGTTHAIAAVPEICVQNSSKVPVYVMIGVPDGYRDVESYGVVWGKVKRGGGECRWTDVDGDVENIVEFKPILTAKQTKSGAKADWQRCTIEARDPQKPVWVIRGKSGALTCRRERMTKTLPGPGDYE